MRVKSVNPHACRSRSRRAVSLVELMIAVTASSMLMAGLASTMFIARQSINVAAVNPSIVRAAAAMEDLTHDLMFADGFNVRTTTAVEFSVPDRTGDSNAETIRYEWSGVPGAPLLRRINGGDWVETATALELLQLSYQLRTVSTTSGASNQSAELRYAEANAQQNLTSHNLTSTTPVGNYLIPVLPANTSSWRISRVQLRLKSAGAIDGVAMLQVRTALGGVMTPTSVVLADATIYEARLTNNYLWHEFVFRDSPEVGPVVSQCIVVVWAKGATACSLEYRSSGSNNPNTGLLKSSANGLVWTARAVDSLQIRVFGTVTTSTPAAANNLYRVDQVGVQLQVNGVDTRVESTIPILNVPEVQGT